jgi:hypothetical protein
MAEHYQKSLLVTLSSFWEIKCMKNYQAIARNEITALKNLIEKLESKNPKWIIRPEYLER